MPAGLEVELADHLGYEPHDSAGRGSGNSRNGTSRKTVTTEIGEVELAITRDRNGTFDPDTPEIVDAWRMSGDVDYLLHVVVADIASYDQFYRKLIAAVPLRNVSSRFSMERMKFAPNPSWCDPLTMLISSPI